MRGIRFCFCHKGFDSSSLPSTSFSYKVLLPPDARPKVPAHCFMGPAGGHVHLEILQWSFASLFDHAFLLRPLSRSASAQIRICI